MTRDDWMVWLRAVLIVIVFWLAAAAVALAADPPGLPAGVTCEQVRAMVAEYGKLSAYAWARLQGYSEAQIAEAKRCLK